MLAPPRWPTPARRAPARDDPGQPAARFVHGGHLAEDLLFGGGFHAALAGLHAEQALLQHASADSRRLGCQRDRLVQFVTPEQRAELELQSVPVDAVVAQE